MATRPRAGQAAECRQLGPVAGAAEGRRQKPALAVAVIAAEVLWGCQRLPSCRRLLLARFILNSCANCPLLGLPSSSRIARAMLAWEQQVHLCRRHQPEVLGRWEQVRERCGGLQLLQEAAQAAKAAWAGGLRRGPMQPAGPGWAEAPPHQRGHWPRVQTLPAGVQLPCCCPRPGCCNASTAFRLGHMQDTVPMLSITACKQNRHISAQGELTCSERGRADWGSQGAS